MVPDEGNFRQDWSTNTYRGTHVCTVGNQGSGMLYNSLFFLKISGARVMWWLIISISQLNRTCMLAQSEHAYGGSRSEIESTSQMVSHVYDQL